MDKIKIKANAKINLCLYITGLKDDGYHEIDSIFQSIHLFDFITLSKHEGIRISCDDEVIPLDYRNICYKSADAFIKKTKIKGVKIDIKKNIPVSAGLGGGSADAAAVIFGLNLLYGCELGQEDLIKIAMLIGADVPFFLKGGCQRASGIGEILVEKHNPFDHDIIIIKPESDNSTPEAYKLYDEINNVIVKTNLMDIAFRNNDEEEYFKSMENDLENSAFILSPDSKTAVETLKENGAKTAMVSGSGSAVFGVFDKGKTDKALKQIKSKGFEKVFLTTKAQKGLEIISTD